MKPWAGAGVTAADGGSANEAIEGKFLLSVVSWFVPHFTPSVSYQKLL